MGKPSINGPFYIDVIAASSTPGSCIKRITGNGCTVFTSGSGKDARGTMKPHGIPWANGWNTCYNIHIYIYIYLFIFIIITTIVLIISIIIVLIYNDLYYTLIYFELWTMSGACQQWAPRLAQVSGNIKRDQATKHPTDKLYIPMFKPRRLPRTRLYILRQLPRSSMTKMHADAGLTETYRNKTLKATCITTHHYSSLYTGVQAILHFSWPKGKNIRTSSKGTLAETNCNSSSSPLLRILP